MGSWANIWMSSWKSRKSTRMRGPRSSISHILRREMPVIRIIEKTMRILIKFQKQPLHPTTKCSNPAWQPSKINSDQAELRLQAVKWCSYRTRMKAMRRWREVPGWPARLARQRKWSMMSWIRRWRRRGRCRESKHRLLAGGREVSWKRGVVAVVRASEWWLPRDRLIRSLGSLRWGRRYRGRIRRMLN